MKKFAISLIALAAISTASFAADRDEDLLHSGLFSAGYGMQINGNSTSNEAFIVAKKWTNAPTAYEIAIMNAIENERNNNDK